MVLELDEQAATPSKRTGSRTMEKEGRRRTWGMEKKGKEKEDGFGNGRERRIRKGISGTEEIGRKKDTRNGRERKNDMGNGREGKKKKEGYVE